MNKKFRTILQVSGLAVATFLTFAAFAVDSESVQSITKGEQVTAKVGGQSVVLDTPVEFPRSIVVSTNGTYTVGGGKARALEDGQTLQRDGKLLSPDGSLVPVFDHITMKSGKVMVMSDGKYSAVTKTRTLPDGTVIYPNGEMTRGRTKTRLLDGQIFALSGEQAAASDTVSMKDGNVVVQKDGSQFALNPRQTLMMNDGSKVFGSGKVEKKSGETIQLKDGQTIEIQGVKRNIP